MEEFLRVTTFKEERLSDSCISNRQRRHGLWHRSTPQAIRRDKEFDELAVRAERQYKDVLKAKTEADKAIEEPNKEVLQIDEQVLNILDGDFSKPD